METSTMSVNEFEIVNESQIHLGTKFFIQLKPLAILVEV